MLTIALHSVRFLACTSRPQTTALAAMLLPRLCIQRLSTKVCVDVLFSGVGCDINNFFQHAAAAWPAFFLHFKKSLVSSCLTAHNAGAAARFCEC